MTLYLMLYVSNRLTIILNVLRVYIKKLSKSEHRMNSRNEIIIDFFRALSHWRGIGVCRVAAKMCGKFRPNHRQKKHLTKG
jgi:hypothetical protein